MTEEKPLNLAPDVEVPWVPEAVPASNRPATISSTEETVPRVSRRFSTVDGSLSYTPPQGAERLFDPQDPMWSTRETIPAPGTVTTRGLFARVAAATAFGALMGFAALAVFL